MAASPAITSPLVDGATQLAKQPRNPLTLKQVEKVLSRFVAVAGLVFAAQAIPTVLAQASFLDPLWLGIVAPVLFSWLVGVLFFSIAQVWVRGSHGTFAVLYLLAVVSLQFAVMPGAEVDLGLNWLNWLLTVAIGMAAIAFSTTLATVVLFVAPIAFMLVRVTPSGGSAPWELAVLECILAIILGGAVLIIVTMLRQAASAVDLAQSTAIERYSNAVRLHATEVERVQVDAIVHDNVLTTLLTAAQAELPAAKALAATMAANAISHLQDAALAAPGDERIISTAELAERISQSVRAFTQPIDLRVSEVADRAVPVHTAATIHSAAVQAIVNSLQHAGDNGVKRWVSIETSPDSTFVVVVGDDGKGFVVAGVPEARLGVRVSIVERVGNAGGHAQVDSAPGRGTSITIRWPRFVAPAQEASQ